MENITTSVEYEYDDLNNWYTEMCSSWYVAVLKNL